MSKVDSQDAPKAYTLYDAVLHKLYTMSYWEGGETNNYKSSQISNLY